MFHGLVSTPTGRHVRISADRRPSVRESDAAGGGLRRRLKARSPAKPQAWGQWPRRGAHSTLVALMPLQTARAIPGDDVQTHISPFRLSTLPTRPDCAG